MYKNTYIQPIVQAAKTKPDRLCPVENRGFKKAFLPPLRRMSSCVFFSAAAYQHGRAA